MRLENWSLVGKKGTSIRTMVLPVDFEPDSYNIVGYVYGRNGFIDGSLVKTSTLVSYDGIVAKTYSGSSYELGKMNDDYLKFIEAHKKGTKILKDWEVGRGHISGYLFEEGIYDEFPQKSKIFGELISQDLETNSCVIKTKNGEEEVFIDWLDIGFNTLMYLQLFGDRELLGSVLEFGPKKIKFDLLGKHKKLLDRNYF